MVPSKLKLIRDKTLAEEKGTENLVRSKREQGRTQKGGGGLTVEAKEG